MEKSSYKASDFKDAKFNVLDIGIEKVIKAFPDLGRYPEFQKDFKTITGLDPEEVIKYVLLMYTDNILNRTIPDLLKRKRESALLAGFEIGLKTRRFPEELEDIFQCQVQEVNELIVRVSRLNNNSAFEQLAIYEEARARQMFKLVGDIIDNEKVKDIHENIRRLSIDIEALERKLLVGERGKEVVDLLYHEIENIQLGIRPEEIAEAKRKGSLDIILMDVYKQKIYPADISDNKPKRRRGGRTKKVKADEQS